MTRVEDRQRQFTLLVVKISKVCVNTSVLNIKFDIFVTKFNQKNIYKWLLKLEFSTIFSFSPLDTKISGCWEDFLILGDCNRQNLQKNQNTSTQSSSIMSLNDNRALIGVILSQLREKTSEFSMEIDWYCDSYVPKIEHSESYRSKSLKPLQIKLL